MYAKAKKIGRIGNFIGILGAAISAAAAVENRRVPRKSDLLALGINPSDFPDIRRGI